MAHAQVQAIEVGLRLVAFERETVARQAVEVDGQILAVVVVLTFVSELTEHFSLRGDLVLALDTHAQTPRVARLVVKSQRRGVSAFFRVAIDFGLAKVGTDERRQVPRAAGLLRDVVAEAAADRQHVTVGIAFLSALVDPKLEFTLEAVVVEFAGGHRQIAPPAVLLILGERGAHVGVEFVFRVGVAGFEFLVIETCGQADTPGFVDAIAAADVQVIPVAIGTGRTVLAVEILMLTAAGNDGAPLAHGLPVFPIGQPLIAQFILMRAQRTLGHFRQQGQLPRGGQQRVGVVGNQALAGFGRVHCVVVDQLGRIRRGAVDAVSGVLGATVAAEAGGRQVLVGREAELRRVGEGFFEQHRDVQWDDFGVDALQLPDQLGVELGAELRGETLQRRAVDGRGQADVRQQPDHDVFGAGALQRAGAVGQAIGCGAGLIETEYAALKEIVAAPRQVIQRVRIGTEAVRRQITAAGAFAGGGLGGDRVEDLVGTVTAHRPVVAIGQTFTGAHGRRRGGGLVGAETEFAADDLGGVEVAVFPGAVLVQRAGAVGVALRGAGRAAGIPEGPGVVQAVAEHDEVRIGGECCVGLGASHGEQATGKRYKQRLFDHEQVRLFIVVGERNDSTKNSRRFAIGREASLSFVPRQPRHIARSVQLSYCAGTYERDLSRVDRQQTSGSSHQGTRPLALARLNLFCRPGRICIALPSLPV
ncbi:hypothetical protein EMIT093MI4_190070 [Pseudomonas sp. IT-93MI4]